MTKKQKILGAACAVGVMSNGGVILSPALPGIIAAFPALNVSTIQMIVTIPALAMVPASLVSGVLKRSFSARKIYLLCLLVLSVSGILPVFFHQFPVILLSRILVGCAIGAMVPIANAEISTHFSGREKDRGIGVFSAVSSIAGAIMMLLSGILCVQGWQYSFLLYLISFLQFFAVLLLCPEEGQQKEVVTQEDKRRMVINRRLLFITLAFLVYMTFLNTFATNISIFITQEGIGQETFSGITSAVFLFSGFLAGLSYEKVKFLLKNQIFSFGFFLSAAGLLIVAVSNSALTVSAGAIIGGFGMGIVIPAGNMMAAESVSVVDSAAAIALSTSGYRFAQFLTPLVVVPLTAWLGGDTARSRFTLSGAVLALCTALVFYVLQKDTDRGRKF